MSKLAFVHLNWLFKLEARDTSQSLHVPERNNSINANKLILHCRHLFKTPVPLAAFSSLVDWRTNLHAWTKQRADAQARSTGNRLQKVRHLTILRPWWTSAFTLLKDTQKFVTFVVFPCCLSFFPSLLWKYRGPLAYLFLIGQSSLKELDKQELGPSVVVGQTCSYFLHANTTPHETTLKYFTWNVLYSVHYHNIHRPEQMPVEILH